MHPHSTLAWGRHLPLVLPATLHRTSQPVTCSGSLWKQKEHSANPPHSHPRVPPLNSTQRNCGCLEDPEGVGNGTFFWLRGKLSLRPSVLREAVWVGNDEGSQ